MCFANNHLRILSIVLVLASAALLFGTRLAPPADAHATPCSRYGDRKPQDLKRKKARLAVVCLINKQRDEHGRSRDLHTSYRLVNAARRHSQTMADRGCFAHQCSGESSPLKRLQNAGYLVGGLSRWAYGENIGWGSDGRGTPRQIVNAWMNSTYHRANILSGTFEDIGVGFAHKGDKGYYTADFGLRRG